MTFQENPARQELPLNSSGLYTTPDHPLHTGMESLAWREVMDEPIPATARSGRTNRLRSLPRTGD